MAWGSASGAPWAAPARARTTRRLSPPIFRGRAVGGCSRTATGALVAGAAFTGAARPLAAQAILEQFSYENLRPSAVQFDLGPLGGSNIRGALTGGARLDYGFIAPHVRVLLGVSYFQAALHSPALPPLDQPLTSRRIPPPP